jgi:SAM-dependent methyltransferase
MKDVLTPFNAALNFRIRFQAPRLLLIAAVAFVRVNAATPSNVSNTGDTDFDEAGALFFACPNPGVAMEPGPLRANEQWQRLWTPHPSPPLPNDIFLSSIEGKRTLEVGGPTPWLGRSFYRAMASIDGVYWSNASVPFLPRPETGSVVGGDVAAPRDALDRVRSECSALDRADVASDEAGAGAPFIVRGTVFGQMHPGDAHDLRPLGVEDASYDLVFASHVLEHLRDPLRALREWDRVLVPGGRIMLVLPWRQGTYDHRRAPATLARLAERFVDAERVRQAGSGLGAVSVPPGGTDDPAARSACAPGSAPVYGAARLGATDVWRVVEDVEQVARDTDAALYLGLPRGSPEATAGTLRDKWLYEPGGMGAVHWHVYDFDLLRDIMQRCLGHRVVLMDLVEPYHQFIVTEKPR